MTDKFFHWFKEKYPVFLNISMVLLFVDVMVDPTNLIFHVKYVLFGLVFVIWLLRNFSKKNCPDKKAMVYPALYCLFHALL